MIHLGDITKIDGKRIEPVDVIVGGSPCQDLSIAGKRAGLAGERSGLYMDQIRIIKEMRDADHQRGRPDELCRPRYMVWENVPGAFSSQKGADFAAVLEEVIRVVEPKAPDVPVPEKGWPTAGCLYDEMGRWSVAWRVHDAQFWGVPQRRRRIALVADFGGLSAPEVLFERKGLRGDSAPSGKTRKGTAGDAKDCTGADDRAGESAGAGGDGRLDAVSGGFCHESAKARSIGWAEELAPTLTAGVAPGVVSALNNQRVFNIGSYHSNAWKSDNPHSGVYETEVSKTLDALNCGYPACNQGGTAIVAIHQNASGELKTSTKGYTLGTSSNASARNTPMIFDARGNGDGETVCTITGDHENRVTDYTALCMDVGFFQTYEERAGTLLARQYEDPPITNQNVVRRLTPLECERLQGFPSEKKWDVSKMTKDEYIAWNLAEKNIIVDAEKGVVYGTRGPGGIPYKEPKQLKGSVVNGYNVVSIRNGATKLQCRVHRIVWISQNGIIPEGYCIDHINNDKQDNRISNLQIMTPSENSKKAKEDGLYSEGLDNKATKLDPDLHDGLCYLYEFSDLTQRELAEIYGISKSRVNQIIKEVGWTDIGEWVDSKGKKHKAADSPRYKALGNSIALPFWFWLLRRISAQYERPATLGSLFDGISGFCLIWARCNGAKNCRWSSEIEEFPMAVTRKHFGDEKTGGVGDIEKYL